MDPQAMHDMFMHTFSADSTLRRNAEVQIKELRATPGYVGVCFQILTADTTPEARLAAAIALKNLFRETWSPSHKVVLADAEKVVAKEHIVAVLMAQTQNNVCHVLAAAVSEVAKWDFPEAWPGLVPSLGAQIQGGEPRLMRNALLALRLVIKRFEYKSPDGRGPLHSIMAETFPLLLDVFRNLLDIQSLEAATIQHLILKVFWSSTHMAFVPDVNWPEWLGLFCAVLEQPLPPSSAEADDVELKAHPAWKIRKWTSRIVTRLMQKYGLLKFAPEGSEAFSTFFSNEVAPTLLGPILTILDTPNQGGRVTRIVKRYCLAYVVEGVKSGSCYQHLREHLPWLVQQICFPTLAIRPDEIELFENDPEEWSRKTSDITEDYLNPRITAMQLIEDLVENRASDALELVLQTTLGIFNDFASRAPDQRDYRAKDAALLSLCVVYAALWKKKRYRRQLPGLLVAHVLPDLSSPVGFLRSRAITTVTAFSKVEYENGSAVEQIVQRVCEMLADPALSVQIEAAKALRLVVRMPGAQELLAPQLAGILEQYFRLMNSVDNELVVEGLQIIIDEFSDQIGPYAVGILQRLAYNFVSYVSNATEDGNESTEDAVMAAVQCLSAISTVLDAVKEAPELYPQLEPVVIPCLHIVLARNGEFLEFLEPALEVLSYLSFYYPGGISSALWELFPKIHEVFMEFAHDYIAEIVTPMDNYISRSPAAFLQGTAALPEGQIPFPRLTCAMAEKVFTNEYNSNTEVALACQLLMSMLHNCPGQVNAYLPGMLKMVVGHLPQASVEEDEVTGRVRLRCALLCTIASALHYNAAATLVVLAQMSQEANTDLTAAVFALLLERAGEDLESARSKKLLCLGLGRLLGLDPASLPAPLQASLRSTVVVMLDTLEQLHEQEELEEESEEDSEEDSEEEDDDDDAEEDESFAANEDAAGMADTEYMALLNSGPQEVTAATVAGIQSSLGGGLVDLSIYEDDYDDDFGSALDQVEQLVFCGEALQFAMDRYGATYEPVLTGAPGDLRGRCANVVAAARAKQQQAQQAAAIS